jgi:hypothetical protein
MAKNAFLFALLLLVSIRLFAIDPVTLYVSQLRKPRAVGTKELPFSILASTVDSVEFVVE